MNNSQDEKFKKKKTGPLCLRTRQALFQHHPYDKPSMLKYVALEDRKFLLLKAM